MSEVKPETTNGYVELVRKQTALGRRALDAQSILAAAEDTMITRAQGRDVGKERSMARCVATFNALTGLSLSVVQGWQFMVVLKMARSQTGINLDDYIDGAAYIALAGEEATK